MSHYKCGEYFRLRLVNASKDKTHTYGANIYKQDGSCGREHIKVRIQKEKTGLTHIIFTWIYLHLFNNINSQNYILL